MGKSKSKTSSTSASIKQKKDIIELKQVLQISSFTDECHDIFYYVIYGDLGIMGIRHSLFSKWKDPQKGRNYYKYNNNIGAHTNKLAALVAGIANLAVLKVFPCLEIVMLCTQNYDENRKAILMLCTQNYDENRKAIVNQNTQEEILSIAESALKALTSALTWIK